MRLTPEETYFGMLQKAQSWGLGGPAVSPPPPVGSVCLRKSLPGQHGHLRKGETHTAGQRAPTPSTEAVAKIVLFCSIRASSAKPGWSPPSPPLPLKLDVPSGDAKKGGRGRGGGRNSTRRGWGEEKRRIKGRPSIGRAAGQEPTVKGQKARWAACREATLQPALMLSAVPFKDTPPPLPPCPQYP